ncbi:glucose-6-phosphate isomerase [Sinobacterium caligoides]|uniref:Glucose-6-phosphate isomerase n=1 Tax=Sinobacterium caligoides TaxID=933926 RepID=A0A3N2DNW2_9GAMM|nr:glucose-6-phosphate isomerase [Sinobacterium caligoides]ROS01456.1 glucose-6-phosphate isomerase [Sinobacterium caligoides]
MLNVEQGLPFSALDEGLLQEVRRWKSYHLSEVFAQDQQRQARFSFQYRQLKLDLSGQCIDESVLEQLQQVAAEADLSGAIESLFSGKKVNNTEQREALHMALRAPLDTALPIPQEYIRQAKLEQARMKEFCQQFQSEDYCNHRGEGFADVVLVGIGGSYLGPKLCYEALKPYHHGSIKLHFLANLDPCEFYDLTDGLAPERTLVVVASKTFTTLETMKNATALRAWLVEGGVTEETLSRHLVAVTADKQKARDFGVVDEHIFSLWDWVGGRFSLWSAIGLPLMLATSSEVFDALLAGAYSMDEHFYEAPHAENMPVLLALVDIWNINYRGMTTRAVVPYSHRLGAFSEYLKQLEMESNGKSVDRNGRPVNYQTACSVWGGVGTLGQHAFFQLLHQGTQEMPIEFVCIEQAERELYDHHQWLNANLKGQMTALRVGTFQQRDIEGYGEVAGSKAASLITLEELTPEALGALIALYEHKVYAQAVIWHINPFDQYGVELGKSLANSEF